MSQRGARAGADLVWEMLWPWLLAAGGAIAGALIRELWLLNSSWRDAILDKVVAACAVFVAYLLTAATIIPAVEEKAIVQRLRSWGYFRYIIGYLRQAIWSSGVLLLISTFVDILPRRLAGNSTVDAIFSALWWGILLLTIGTVVRATKLLLHMIVAR